MIYQPGFLKRDTDRVLEKIFLSIPFLPTIDLNKFGKLMVDDSIKRWDELQAEPSIAAATPKEDVIAMHSL